MSLATLLVHDVTVIHAGTVTDRYGNTAKDWATATSTAVKGWISQRSAFEEVEGREAQVSQWVAFFHPTVTVAAGDRLEWSGITFEVDGPPNPAWTPRGLDHYEAPLRVVTG